MSRSHRKRKFCGMTSAESEKKDKKTWHRKFRQWIKQKVTIDDTFCPVAKDKHTICQVWSMSKDGKQYYGDLKKTFRKWASKSGREDLYTDEYIERAYFECDRK